MFRYRRVRAFDYHQANGNLTEFGGSALSAGTLHTRSLFKDGAGNPITITKTSSEQLVITYDVEFTAAPTAAAGGNVSIAGLGREGRQPGLRQGRRLRQLPNR